MSAWYAQTNYSAIQGINGKYKISQVGCFLTAYCNLLRRFGKEVAPDALNQIFIQRGIWIDVDDGVRDDLGWPSITAYDGTIHATATGTSGWPNTNNAIVKFHYQSISQPWKSVNGARVANMIDHFCLVADEHAHTIIDSWDGVLKAPGAYGEPVGWASYENVVPQPVSTPLPEPVSKPGSIYVIQKGDTIWDIARRFGFTAAELMEHNNITDPRTIPVGYQLHLPVAQPVLTPAPDPIKYKAYDAARPMHIVNGKGNGNGTEKWAFGNIKHWGDFTSIGHVAENYNVDILGEATVEVDSDTAVYMMDAAAFGDYKTTGKVNNPIGYSHADLVDGYYTAPAVPQSPAIPPQTEVIPPAPTPVEAPAIPPVVEPSLPTLPTAYSAPVPQDPKWKDSYADFPDGPRQLYARNFTIVPEYGRVKPDKHLDADQALEYIGAFKYNGNEYFRPTVSKRNGDFYGAPETALMTEDEWLSRIEIQTDANKAAHQLDAKKIGIILSATIKRVLNELPTFLKKIKTAKAK